jgi:hypothetical protein
MSTAPVTTSSINVVTKAPPSRDFSHLKPRQKDSLSLLIEGLAVGQCLEYRGPLKQSVMFHRAYITGKRTKKAYACRKTDGGCDIYCTGVKE